VQTPAPALKASKKPIKLLSKASLARIPQKHVLGLDPSMDTDFMIRIPASYGMRAFSYNAFSSEVEAGSRQENAVSYKFWSEFERKTGTHFC